MPSMLTHGFHKVKGKNMILGYDFTNAALGWPHSTIFNAIGLIHMGTYPILFLKLHV